MQKYILFLFIVLNLFSCVTLSKGHRVAFSIYGVTPVNCISGEESIALEPSNLGNSSDDAIMRLRNIAADKKAGFLIVTMISQNTVSKYYAQGLIYRCN